MTSSVLTNYRNSAERSPEQAVPVSIEVQSGDGGMEETSLSVQEEILAELRAINEVLKGIANTMENMERNFWT